MSKEWFDPLNIDHCKAYRHLQKTGTWPEGFKLHDICDDPLWQVTLMKKMTREWIDQILEYDDYMQMNKEEVKKYIEGDNMKFPKTCLKLPARATSKVVCQNCARWTCRFSGRKGRGKKR